MNHYIWAVYPMLIVLVMMELPTSGEMNSIYCPISNNLLLARRHSVAFNSGKQQKLRLILLPRHLQHYSSLKCIFRRKRWWWDWSRYARNFVAMLRLRITLSILCILIHLRLFKSGMLIPNHRCGCHYFLNWESSWLNNGTVGWRYRQ